jgi:dTDP-4-dehydrorhamnose 3,5-epimerase
MKRIETPIADLQVFEPTVFGDDRGFFMETFRAEWFPGYSFVQDNHSKSVSGTLRGMHYQLNNPQGKLVRVTDGEVYDVALDLRQSSKTFGQWHGTTLSADNNRLFWVPPGFAHGFIVTSETAEFQYKCTDYYAPTDEHCIAWNDPALAIDWPLGETAPLLSGKDEQGLLFKDAVYYD